MPVVYYVRLKKECVVKAEVKEGSDEFMHLEAILQAKRIVDTLQPAHWQLVDIDEKEVLDARGTTY